MSNPVLCEVTRGGQVESWHRGAFAVVDADGAVVLAGGDIDTPVYPRSAVKAIQALTLVESGAADAYGFGDRELALACASHGGEAFHVEGVTGMLKSAGLTVDALECGAHWPSIAKAAAKLSERGEKPTQLHNNCSGKHTGFLCASVHKGIDHRGYIQRDHPIQREVVAALEHVIGASHSVGNCATDGCSIPTHAVPLQDLAGGFARMATGIGLEPARAVAAKRLFAACMNQPLYVDGTGQPCAALLTAGQGQLFAKNGAEGVYCGALPTLGLGIAVKIDDGTMRAAVVAFAAVIMALIENNDGLRERVAPLARHPLLNQNKFEIGEIRPAGPLAG